MIYVQRKSYIILANVNINSDQSQKNNKNITINLNKYRKKKNSTLFRKTYKIDGS